MSTVTISRIPNPVLPKNNEKIIHTDNIEYTIKSLLDDNKPSQIYISTNEDNSYDDARIAFDYRVGLLIGEKKVSTNLKGLTKALFLINKAKSERDIATSIDNALYHITKQVPAKMSMVHMRNIFKANIDDENKIRRLIKQVEKRISELRSITREAISFNDSSHVEYVNVAYDSDAVELIKRPGLHIVNGEMGSGKTSRLMMPAFEHFCDESMLPIFMNGSRVLSRSMLPEFDERFYKYAAEEGAKGALGVVYKLMLDENYAPFRANSKHLFIDEIEDVLNLMTAPIAGTLEERKLLVSRFNSQVVNSKTVIVSDAMISQFTFDMLLDLANQSGKKVFVYNQTIQHKKPKIQIVSKKENVFLTSKEGELRRKIAVFCDASHNQRKSSLNALIESIKPSINGKSVLVDGAFMQSERATELSNAKTFSEAHSVIFYNSAAKNGLSIVNQDFKSVSLFLAGTVSPADAIQAARRFRSTELVRLSFQNNTRKILTQEDAIARKIVEEAEDSDQLSNSKFFELIANNEVKWIASRIAFNNRIRKNYEFSVITMFELLNYEIEYIDENEENRQRGAEHIKRGSMTEIKNKTESIITAPLINVEEANRLRLSGDLNTLENKAKLEKFDLINFYKVNEVDTELIEFDRAGIGRRLIKNHLLVKVQEKPKNLDEAFNIRLVKKLFEIIRPGERYSQIEAAEFMQFVHNESIEINKIEKKAKEVFFSAFPHSRILTTDMKTISGILKNELGYTVTKEKNRKVNGKTISTNVATLEDKIARYVEYLS